MTARCVLLMEKAEKGLETLLFMDASHFVMGCDFLGYIYGKNPYLQTVPTEFGFYRIGLYIEDFSGNQTPIL